ncbi:hypothetical protein M5X02_30720 [Paenibacillus alvei]|nr:hypothetical protein [Paenibacillus alvei]EJW13953.1 hypothetical protein PAV_141p00590 [Paenibacillus alvei DSM 29]MCY9545001.1 hypothetical protein [Paenibacillus alvei]MCY9707684.1 hypothetical protein [Paenibacillus alvei]MEC0082803.1 hypothetical protein [Paenibacillus alvei]
MKAEIEQIIKDLEYEREEYGERIVSLHYGYDSALEKLCKLVGKEFTPYE